jgi:hypothetical protein
MGLRRLARGKGSFDSRIFAMRKSRFAQDDKVAGVEGTPREIPRPAGESAGASG